MRPLSPASLRETDADELRAHLSALAEAVVRAGELLTPALLQAWDLKRALEPMKSPEWKAPDE